MSPELAGHGGLQREAQQLSPGSSLLQEFIGMGGGTTGSLISATLILRATRSAFWHCPRPQPPTNLDWPHTEMKEPGNCLKRCSRMALAEAPLNPQPVSRLPRFPLTVFTSLAEVH